MTDGTDAFIAEDGCTAWAWYDPFRQPVSTGQHVSLAPGAHKRLEIWADVDLLDARRPHGWML